MRVFFHNFNPSSNSGPNKFTRQLFNNLLSRGKVSIAREQNTADVEFCLISMAAKKIKPALLRLDGIYFNTSQDFTSQNAPIRYAYQEADHVVFQSRFNRALTEHWFGKKQSCSVIHNSADLEIINSIKTDQWDNFVEKDREVWSCASSWRPHKRLKENLRYFLEKAPPEALMLVAGKDADLESVETYNSESGGRIRYLGELDYYSLVSMYKRSKKFLHLSFIDHCPNVVVDAQAAGCEIVCSSTGGTSELVQNGEIILEPEWDFSPIELYKPPSMNFEKAEKVSKTITSTEITETADMYFDRLASII